MPPVDTPETASSASLSVRDAAALFGAEPEEKPQPTAEKVDPKFGVKSP